MCLTYTRVNNSNLDALAGDARVPELVHLRHQVRREGVVALGPLREDVLDGVAGRVDDVVRDRVAADRVDGLDLWHGGHLGGHLVGILGVLELDGRALEQLEAEVLAQRRLASEVVDQGIGVLGS